MPNPNLSRGSQFKRHGGVALDSDYLTYEGAMSTPPSATWQTAVNQMVLDIKTALSITNLSDAFDVMYFLAAETEQASRLNMVQRAHDCTATAAPTFAASRGVTGNGTTQFLDTNYNPATQGVQYTLNSASIGVYSRTDANNSGIDIGWTNGTQLCRVVLRNSGNFNVGINRNSVFSVAVPDSLALFVGNRSTSTASQSYRRGVLAGSESSPSTSIASFNCYLLANNTSGTAASFSTRQLAFAFAGRSMDATQQANFYTAVQTAMTAIGASV